MFLYPQPHSHDCNEREQTSHYASALIGGLIVVCEMSAVLPLYVIKSLAVRAKGFN